MARTQSPSDPIPAAPPPPRRRSRLGLFVVLFLLLVLGGVVLYVWGTLHFSYSEGERAGYIQKFSRKGWICKTWEGEIQMVSMPGTLAQTFQFSVRDPAVAEQINRNMGRRVALHYEQHKGVPTSCFGETEYYVTRAEPVAGP